MNSLLASKACDITSVVRIACARHGCYALNSLVDRFKGEQQKNADFAFLKALTCTNVAPEQGTLLITLDSCYDFKRLRQSSTVVGLKVQVLMSLEECKS